MPDHDSRLPSVPESKAVPKKQTRLSLVWVIPILAALVGAWVAVTRILAEGPEITITFETAEGLEAGKTKIEFTGVEVGTVKTVRLSEDHEHVIVTAQMAPKTENFLVDDTHFWVVRPRISGANVSGLGTLISGAYIGMEIGKSPNKRRDFVALENPPVVASDAPGRFFVLKTPTLGSLDVGTPLFFRRLEVGQVTKYGLDEDGQALSVQVFVKAPYDQYVNPDTRFWNASGIDVSLSANGLSVQTQSLLSILVGGIAFETPSTGPVLPPAEPDRVFRLATDRADAFRPAAHDPQTYLLVFKGSVRGLAPGAPVEFRGIPIGEVVEVRGEIDVKTFQFSAPVLVRIEPQRFGAKVVDLPPGTDLESMRHKLIDELVAHGVRARLETGSLLTGALFVAFDFVPDAPRASVDWSQKPAQLPTVPGEIQALEDKLGSVVKKIEQIDFKGIGDDLKKTINNLDATLTSARGTLDNADKLIAPDSVLGAELGSTLQEVNRAARALRVLADYLERHPESLIRGKEGDSK